MGSFTIEAAPELVKTILLLLQREGRRRGRLSLGCGAFFHADHFVAVLLV